MQPPIFLAGQKVTLGPIDPSDTPQYARWVNDPGVRPFLNRPFPVSIEDERRRVESLIGATDAVGFSIRVKESGLLIGRSAIRGIHPVNRSGVFTIFIGEGEYRSRGFGREATALTMIYAMDVLNLNRLELEVFAYNDRAARAYEALGFVREGVRREAKFHEGEYHDAVTMAVLASDWRPGLRDRLRAHLDESSREWPAESASK